MLTTRSNAHNVQAKVDKQSMTQTPNLRLSRLLGCCNLVHLHMQWSYLLKANLLHSHLLLLPYLLPSPNFLHSHLLLSMMRPPDVCRAPVHPS